jgi:hypothetical protein
VIYEKEIPWPHPHIHISWHMPGGTEEDHRNSRSVFVVLRPNFELSTSEMQSLPLHSLYADILFGIRLIFGVTSDAHC